MIFFLIIALIIAIFIIWGLATHNNNVDEQVRIRSDNAQKILEEQYSKLCRNKELEYQKKCAEIQDLYNAKERAYKELHDRLKGEYQTKFEQNSLDYKKKCQEVESRYQARIVDLDQKQQEAITLYDTYTKELSKIDDIIKQKLELYPHLAAVMADLLTAHFDYSIKYLKEKSHPAHTEAFRIGQLKKETKKIIEEKKILEYQLSYIRKLIPNIDDIFDSGYIDEGTLFEAETEDNTDRVRFYLEPEEYQKLTSIERNQLALDRYIAGRKSKWQIGRDYEMYCGYLYEKKVVVSNIWELSKVLKILGAILL
jgi:Skp family chaperone for outer membrane proteins